MPTNPYVILVQSVLFMNNVVIPDKLGFASELSSVHNRLFNGEPVLLPVPFDDAPPEVPRIMLKDKNDSYSCNVAANRIDFFLRQKEEERETLRATFPEYQERLRSVATLVTSKVASPIVRLGLVIRQGIGLDHSANEFIAQHYVRTDSFAGPHELQLNVLHKIRLGEFDVNRWIKLRPLARAKQAGEEYALGFEVDINTQREKPRTFGQKDIQEFFRIAYEHLVTQVNPVIAAGENND